MNGSSSIDSIESYAGSGVASLTAADMTNMDIKQLENYAAGADATKINEKTGQTDAAVLAKLANEALTDEHLSKDLSEQTRKQLETMAQAGGYSVPAQSKMSGDSGKIHTDAPAQTQTVQVSPAQSDSQQISATQAAQQIQDAVNSHRASASTDPLVQKAEQQALDAIRNGTADSAPKNVIIGPDGKPLGRA